MFDTVNLIIGQDNISFLIKLFEKYRSFQVLWFQTEQTNKHIISVFDNRMRSKIHPRLKPQSKQVDKDYMIILIKWFFQ